MPKDQAEIGDELIALAPENARMSQREQDCHQPSGIMH